MRGPAIVFIRLDRVEDWRFVSLIDGHIAFLEREVSASDNPEVVVGVNSETVLHYAFLVRNCLLYDSNGGDY